MIVFVYPVALYDGEVEVALKDALPKFFHIVWTTEPGALIAVEAVTIPVTLIPLPLTVAIWFPLEPVDKESGALNYALGSHKEGIKGSTDLHTRKPFDNENRELIPENPESSGYKVKCMEMSNTDMLCHNGYTWHYSGPNKKQHYTRKGFSVRFITEKSTFDPRPGQGAAFTKQIDINPGETLEGKPFPIIIWVILLD